jgi:hypothetical protein
MVNQTAAILRPEAFKTSVAGEQKSKRVDEKEREIRFTSWYFLCAVFQSNLISSLFHRSEVHV